jgi:hypothetical protein
MIMVNNRHMTPQLPTIKNSAMPRRSRAARSRTPASSRIGLARFMTVRRLPGRVKLGA